MKHIERTKRLTSGAAALALVCATATAAPQRETTFAETPLAIRAERVHVEGGKVIENGVVLIEGQTISAVGAGLEIPEGAQLIEHEGDLSAGLIALRDAAGAAGENYDSTRTLLPEAELAHAFDPTHTDFDALVREGVTTVVLTPHEAAVAGGISAVVKTDGGRVLRRRGHLSLSFSARSLNFNRFPTSYAGAVAEFERCFEAGKGSFAEATAGRLPILLDAREEHEVARAIAFARARGLKGLVSGSPVAGKLADQLAAAGLGVVLPAFQLGLDSRTFEGAVALAKAGVPFGFGLDSPANDGSALRAGAAACLRAGLGPDVAWRALTSDAAALAGVGKHVGRIAAGYDADLVLWSGSPLDLGSRVEAVVVDGSIAYRAPEREDDDEEEGND